MGFFASYPITPASEILHALVGTKVKALQMEDEIASLNAVIGASMAGLKAMTATSGPGFSLMQESIGFAHMTETPLVIVDVQRVGPSTGMPTLPAQGDLMQSRYGSHGDYFPIVFYPNSVAELYRFTFTAFNAAEESLSPVILLSDGYISHLYETIEVRDFRVAKRRKKPLGAARRHFTGLTHERNVPEATNTRAHRALIAHLEMKQARASQKYACYEYIPNRRADALLITYGGLSRAAYALRKRYSLFRPIRMFPVLDELGPIAKRYRRIVVAEMNAGQYVRLVEGVVGKKVRFVPVLGGRVDLAEFRRMLA
jgi:2-oxoglutarate ferredoxin oxidoreductase subunit alpha